MSVSFFDQVIWAVKLINALEHCKLQLKKVYIIYFIQFCQFKEKHVYYNNDFSPDKWFWITYDYLYIFSDYWMRLSSIWRILQIEEGVIHRGRSPRWITPSEICRILHILQKPNSKIVLLFIQNISSFLKEFRHYALCFSAHQI